MLKHWKMGVVGILYMLLAAPMFYYIDGAFEVASYGIMYYYVFAAGIILLGFIAFLVTGNVTRLKLLTKMGAVLWLPYLFSLLYSFVIWIYEFTQLSIMTRGFFFAFYQLIAILTAAATILLFGEQAPWMQLTAMSISYSIHIVEAAQRSGWQNLWEEYKNLILSFGLDTGQIIKKLELHTLMFAFGIYLAYLLLRRMKWWTRILILIPVTLLFLMGFKRIVFAGIVCAWAVSFFLKRRKKEKSSFRWMLLIGTCALLVCFIYNLLIAGGGYETLMNRLHIDTKGRIEMYNERREWYSISPGFSGHGVGFVSRMLSDENKRGSGALHNDILVMYIEMGFWGFLIWGAIYIIVRSWLFFRIGGKETGILFFALILFCLCTYATDNSYYYFYMNLSLACMVMSYQIKEGEKKELDKIG